MRMCLTMDPVTFDSRRNADPCTSTFHFLIYEGLTRIRSDGAGELALAESVDLSSDGKTYLFHLREAQWSDGTPITAFDFEHSWKTTLTPSFAAPCPYLLYPIKNAEAASLGRLSPAAVGVEAVDARTLKVELEYPTPYFLSLITFCNFYPIPKHIEAKNPQWDRASDREQLFSGPFRVERWDRNREIILKKNPTYWDAKHVHLDEVVLPIISSDRTTVQMFERGELDFVGTITSPLSPDELSYCHEKQLLSVKPLGGLLFCTFNLNRFPFHNRNIRKALSLAVDREAIVHNISQLSETPATSCVPPVLRTRPSLHLFPNHDPRLAREALLLGLEELHTTPERLSEALILSYEGDGLYRRIAQTIQFQWKTVLGLDAKLAEYERKTLIAKHMQKDYAVGIDRFYAQYFDPNNLLERFKHKGGVKNLPDFDHPSYRALLDEAARAGDPERRLQLLERAEELLAFEMPIAPLLYLNQGLLISPHYDRVEFSPLGNLLIKNLVPKP